LTQAGTIWHYPANAGLVALSESRADAAGPSDRAIQRAKWLRYGVAFFAFSRLPLASPPTLFRAGFFPVVLTERGNE